MANPFLLISKYVYIVKHNKEKHIENMMNSIMVEAQNQVDVKLEVAVLDLNQGVFAGIKFPDQAECEIGCYGHDNLTEATEELIVTMASEYVRLRREEIDGTRKK